mmetsp:Transcript_26303/g.84647  ORF Transcript_26303/g.84647 Transcript_26303/m.84647 type:complete len:273 (+) Transcript_26303:1179-1997(+)
MSVTSAPQTYCCSITRFSSCAGSSEAPPGCSSSPSRLQMKVRKLRSTSSLSAGSAASSTNVMLMYTLAVRLQSSASSRSAASTSEPRSGPRKGPMRTDDDSSTPCAKSPMAVVTTCATLGDACLSAARSVSTAGCTCVGSTSSTWFLRILPTLHAAVSATSGTGSLASSSHMIGSAPRAVAPSALVRTDSISVPNAITAASRRCQFPSCTCAVTNGITSFAMASPAVSAITDSVVAARIDGVNVSSSTSSGSGCFCMTASSSCVNGFSAPRK